MQLWPRAGTNKAQELILKEGMFTDSHRQNLNFLTLHSRATKDFGKTAVKFMKDVDQQMGVKIFMMFGYEDEDGILIKGKYVPLLLCYTICLCAFL
jgi:hypothetical protein